MGEDVPRKGGKRQSATRFQGVFFAPWRLGEKNISSLHATRILLGQIPNGGFVHQTEVGGVIGLRQNSREIRDSNVGE